MFTEISATNFKSFKDLHLSLRPFEVIIGANASGKSNFIHIFRFLRDLATHGLDNAISLQGGVEYLRNLNLGPSRDLTIGVTAKAPLREVVDFAPTPIGFQARETSYRLTLKFASPTGATDSVDETLTYSGEFVWSEGGALRRGKQPAGAVILSNANGKVQVKFDGAPMGRKPESIEWWLGRQLESGLEGRRKKLLLQAPGSAFGDWLRPIAIYDFDPRLSKRAAVITGKADLEEDASNLAIVLKNLLEDDEKKRQLFNLLREALPFIDQIGVERFADRSLLLKLRETYFADQDIPASLASDGTLNILALLVALYFERAPLTIIEEPEKNIHPYLISRVVEMAKDAAAHKQVILSTHNPEIVKHAGLDNLILVSRDKHGFSVASRPADVGEIRTFLENEMGLDELYVDNLLELPA